ncbi:hypothetical protein BCR36DRAFT_365188 [Piromyces finnis]|nr:hypothetical protein BCR36DRAFT_365188 [Piromyces finnis]|eukprot:ORX35204.1 hypothetical protein BCR36DRAFT_365188 [Piromyces finnis]
MNSQGLFNHYYDYKRGINDSNNTDFILDNIFYVMNMAHDMFAFAGFDEKEKNMQTYYFNYNNQERNYYSKGGNLHVTLNHNKKFENGSNNICESTYDTNFKESKITLGTFFVNGEVRSSGLDNGVLIHEYTHLVFEHLVKNDEGFNCSFNRESECLNEGTADFFAEAFHYKKTNNKNDEYVIGKYLNITRYAVISSDKNVSPLHYGDFNYRNGNSKYKYLGGAIWHSMLHDALYNLCEKYNCEEITSDKIRRYENDEEPPMNYLFMKYIIEALKLTGCQPTFLQLRNEILNLSLSDKNIKNNKDVYCRIYAGFANRYFGVDAEKIRISSNDRAVLAAGNVSSKLPSLCGNDYDYLIENI